MPAWSTTGEPLFSGNFCAAAGVANASSSQKAARMRVTSAGVIRAEIYRRRLLRTGRRFERHLGLGAVKNLGADRVRERPDARVIGLHRLVVVAARGVDAVLGAFQLVLKREEVRVGLEVRIGLLKPLQRIGHP